MDFTFYRRGPNRVLGPNAALGLMQVHARTKRCLPGDRNVTCNCAVAMREGNWLFILYACDLSKEPLAIRALAGLEPGAEFTRVGQLYIVRSR